MPSPWAVTTTYSQLCIPERQEMSLVWIWSPPSTLEVICEVFIFPKLQPPCVTLIDLQSDAHQWHSFQLGFLRKGQCLPLCLLLTFSPLALRPAHTTQVEAQGCSDPSRFTHGVPTLTQHPFSVREPSSLYLRLMSPLQWMAASTLGTKVPKCDPQSFLLMPPPAKGDVRTSAFTREVPWRP